MNRFTDVDPIIKRLPHTYGYLDGPLLPLSKALRSICHQINHLDKAIETAKKSCHFPSEHGLTRDQSAAVYLYTMEMGNFRSIKH